MRLGTKLLLLGSILLAVPWVGLRYMDQMQDFALQGRIQAQTLVATTLAAALAGHQDLLLTAAEGAASALYKEPLPGNIELDAYTRDWNADGAVVADRPEDLQLRLGERDTELYVLIQIPDDQVRYRRPEPGAIGDAVQLAWRDSRARVHRYLLSPEGPGVFTVLENGFDGRQPGSALVDSTSPIRVAWGEYVRGYRLELKIAESDVQALHLTWQDVDVDGSSAPRHEELTAGFLPLVGRSSQIEGLLHRVAGRFSGSIQVLDVQGWVRGASDAEAPPRLDDELSRGALLGEPAVERRERAYGAVDDIRAVEPILSTENDGRRVIGAVVVDQDTKDVLFMQLRALQNLALESLLVLMVVIGGLLLFAWRLAWRIQRLGNAAAGSIDGAGRIVADHLDADQGAADEIGGLSRHISGLLGRLARYTRFLERMPRTLRHEINNPLNVISTSLHNYREAHPESADDPYLDSVGRATTRMGYIVKGMTEAASLEEALRSDAFEPLDLADLVRTYAHSAAISHPDRRILCDFGPKEIWIRGSDVRIEQLLDKLLDNALDFTPAQGDIRILMSSAEGWALLSLENDGPQISADLLPCLFESMTSIRSEPPGERPHLGIGLFVAGGIVEGHGGKIGVVNQQNPDGVAFTVRIPLL